MSAIGSDFTSQAATKRNRCSECNGWIFVGSNELVSVKNGKIQKRVCSEDCRLEFDARFWADAAIRNGKRRASR